MVDGFSAVLDCSGTYGNGNYLGRGGAPRRERGLRIQPRPITTAIKPPPGGWPMNTTIPRDAFDGYRMYWLGRPPPPRPGSRTVTTLSSGGTARRQRSVPSSLAASRHHLYELPSIGYYESPIRPVRRTGALRAIHYPHARR